MPKSTIDTSSPEFRARAEERRRTWTMTVFKSFDDFKADEERRDRLFKEAMKARGSLVAGRPACKPE